jgi:predicted porin
LLPNYLAVSGTTRQNDLDVSFTISINPGSSTTQGGKQSSQQENRQAFLTFGDKSWGSVKLGKDLGVFASDAILNDMTLLGVGSGAGGLAGNTTTTGRIGTGFMYADWKAQAVYTTPNFNGFQATAGITQAWNNQSIMAFTTLGTTPGGGTSDAQSAGRGGAAPAFEGKASYSFAANDVTGKIWVSGITQKLDNITAGYGGTVTDRSRTAYAGDIGANINVGGFGLTGYYYAGEGIGQTIQFFGGLDKNGAKRDSNGGYVQATYTLPTKTKLGASWGQSTLERTGSADNLAADLEDTMWVVGAYHPLTKHLNLVAEYSDVESDYGTKNAKGRTVSAGAILFF